MARTAESVSFATRYAAVIRTMRPAWCSNPTEEPTAPPLRGPAEGLRPLPGRRLLAGLPIALPAVGAEISGFLWGFFGAPSKAPEERVASGFARRELSMKNALKNADLHGCWPRLVLHGQGVDL